MASHTPDKDPAKVWSWSPVGIQHEVLNVLRDHAMGAALAASTTRSTNPDVLAVYRARVEAFEAVIAILEAAKEE